MELNSQNEGDLKNKDEPPKKDEPKSYGLLSFLLLLGAILDEGWEFDQNI